MDRKKLVLVDGHSLAYRAFHALPIDMQTSTGELSNASFGFTMMLISVLESEKPDYMIVAFDKGPSFRAREYAEYKAHERKCRKRCGHKWRVFIKSWMPSDSQL